MIGTRWREANPCYDRPGFAAALDFDRTRLPEHEFRRFRMGLWTVSDIAWLPAGVWASRAAPQRVVDEGEKVWLGFDGSRSQDSTALVGITADRHIFVAGCWENPGVRRGGSPATRSKRPSRRLSPGTTS